MSMHIAERVPLNGIHSDTGMLGGDAQTANPGFGHGSDSRRPFICQICRARFTRKDVCKRHTERCRGVFGRVVAVSEAAEASFDEGQDDQEDSPDSHNTMDLTAQDADAAAAIAHESLQVGQRPVSRERPPIDTIMDSADTYMMAYFDNFHPSFPLLHRQSIGRDMPRLSKQVIVCIGILFASKRLPETEATHVQRKGQELWEAGHDEIWNLVERDWREIRRTWVMQSWLLHIIYGTFTGKSSHFHKARRMLRWIVDSTRELGLMRQNVFTSTTRYNEGEEQTLHDHWMSYVESESMKLCMYTMLFLDSHIFSPCNIRPLTSPIELDWELPLPGALWEAETSLAWAQKLGDEPRTLYLTRSPDNTGISCPTTKSLNLSIQSLMTDTPSPQLLAALRGSTMSALFILTGLETLVKDFTRCYYQLPPALADPNAFHILTQLQNRQVSAALRYAAEIITSQLAEATSSNWQILKFAERIAQSVRLSLCKPDDLLIGGIVENSVVAGLTTATHLALGLQVGARRSLQNLLRYNAGDDGMLVFLDDLMDVLSDVMHPGQQDPVREAPWATVATYRILLSIWRLLRWAAGEMRRKAGAQPTVRSKFEASTIVFEAIHEVINRSDSQARRFPARDPATIGMVSETTEARFMEIILQFWKDRPVWAMGSFMTTVLEEIRSAGGMAYELRYGAPLPLPPPPPPPPPPPHRSRVHIVTTKRAARGRRLRSAAFAQGRVVLYELAYGVPDSHFSLACPTLFDYTVEPHQPWQIPRVFGWYGLGSMGIGMALNLQNHVAANALPPLRYSNRTISRGDALKGISNDDVLEGRSLSDSTSADKPPSSRRSNIFVIGFQELTAEAQVFAEKRGLGTQQMERFMADMYGPRAGELLEAHDLGRRRAGRVCPSWETALARMRAARGFAGDALDSSAVYGAARLEAGLSFWNERSRPSK
ncbi:Zinc finger protein [Colletotrichum trifolii]|uniref:Zinc finger protein n=1 Tax=Colletotrichum trifolii TaxID=5466 RepID=A0A4R8QA50_COLTR|nr:Zinc finger protein [Colletotrichum trifolii]